MAIKRTQTTRPNTTDSAKAVTPADPWTPQVDTQPDFNPFANIETAARSPGATLPTAASPPAIREPRVDTAPLQGMHDLSDPDSLTDVIAAGSSQRSPASAKTSGKSRRTLSAKPRKSGR